MASADESSKGVPPARPRINIEEVNKTDALTPRVRRLRQRLLEAGKQGSAEKAWVELTPEVQDETRTEHEQL